MSVRKTVLCPYTRWEFDRVEGWCEEMERRGLRLVRFKGQFAVLEDGAPRDTRYRFCAAETGTDAGFKEERQKYADFGWGLLENTSVALTLPLLICVPLLLGCLIYSAVRTNRTAKRLEAGELDRGFDPREIRARYIFFIFTATVIFVAVTTLLLMWIK